MEDKIFELLLNGIQDQLSNARDHYAIFWQLFEGLKIYNVFNNYPIFFYNTLLAHDGAFILSIHNITLYETKTANLPRLFKYIENNYNLREMYALEQIQGMRKIVRSHSKLIKRISDQRNKYIAHNEIGIDAYKKLPVYSKDEGEKLLIDLDKILTAIKRDYDHTEGSIFKWVPHYNCQDLLKNLQIKSSS
jgi:AbiU2